MNIYPARDALHETHEDELIWDPMKLNHKTKQNCTVGTLESEGGGGVLGGEGPLLCITVYFYTNVNKTIWFLQFNHLNYLLKNFTSFTISLR